MVLRVMILGLIASLFIRAGYCQTDAQPDFSYLFHSGPKGDEWGIRLGPNDDPGPFTVPSCVKELFRGPLNEEWNYLSDLFKDLPAQYAKSSPDKKIRLLKEWFGPIVKVKLPDGFGQKELYVLKIEKEAVPHSRSWYFAVFDPEKRECSSSPASIVFNESFNYSFEDIFGNGTKEMVAQTHVHNGTSSKEITRYYSFGKDLSIKEIYAYVNRSSNGMQSWDSNGEEIKRVGKKRVPNNVQTTGKKYLSKEAVKSFDPVRAEEEFNSF